MRTSATSVNMEHTDARIRLRKWNSFLLTISSPKLQLSAPRRLVTLGAARSTFYSVTQAQVVGGTNEALYPLKQDGFDSISQSPNSTAISATPNPSRSFMPVSCLKAVAAPFGIGQAGISSMAEYFR